MSHPHNSVSGPQHHFLRLRQNLRMVLLSLLGLTSFFFSRPYFYFFSLLHFSVIYSLCSVFLFVRVGYLDFSKTLNFIKSPRNLLLLLLVLLGLYFMAKPDQLILMFWSSCDQKPVCAAKTRHFSEGTTWVFRSVKRKSFNKTSGHYPS